MPQVPTDSFYTGFNASYSSWGALFLAYSLPSRTLVFNVVHNSTLMHALPLGFQQVLQAFYSDLAQDAGYGTFTVGGVNYPFPYNPPQFDASSYVAVMMIGMALCMGAASFPIEPVKERERKITHQLTVMGITPRVYWIATFVRDFTLLCIPCAFVLILVWAFSISSLTGPAFLPLVVLLVVFMGPMIMVVHLLGLLFDHYETAQT